ncbi:Hypothetical protein POVR2_LOCUS92 [uncultured virus]|nr:Hypothetical protein POVR2_LOCUS92 [uncultured virus]
MNSDILEQILSINPPDIYEDVEIEGEMKRLKLDSRAALTVLALNVILVLEGQRLAYRMSQLADLAPLVLEISQGALVSLPLIPNEPLLLSKSNLARVVIQLKQDLSGPPSDNKAHIAFGNVLGYAYVGEDWMGSGNEYNISYNSGGLSLYSFNIPKHGYTREIRDKIEADLARYRTTLAPYGYTVHLSVMSWDDGRHTISDKLPLL